MISLLPNFSLYAIAGNSDTISYTIIGYKQDTVEPFRVLKQGSLQDTLLPIYTCPPSGGPVLIKRIILSNTNSSSISGISLYLNGEDAVNLIQPPFPLMGHGRAVFTESGDTFYDGTGRILANTPVTTVNVSGDGGGSNRKYNQSLDGVQDGSNLVFTTVDDFTAKTTSLYLNGQKLTLDFDYTETGINEITFEPGVLVYSTDVLRIDYDISEEIPT